MQGAGVHSGGGGSGIYNVIHAVFTNYSLPEGRVSGKIGTVCDGEDHWVITAVLVSMHTSRKVLQK
jgi:hypothetical protein